MDKYSVYCEFDLQKHKETYVNYLEVVIDSDGKVMYAVPSHQEKLIRMGSEKAGMSREEFIASCPKEWHYDYLKWLCIQTGAVCVWNDQYYGVDLTLKQRAALRTLKMAGVYHGVIPK